MMNIAHVSSAAATLHLLCIVMVVKILDPWSLASEDVILFRRKRPRAFEGRAGKNCAKEVVLECGGEVGEGELNGYSTERL